MEEEYTTLETTDGRTLELPTKEENALFAVITSGWMPHERKADAEQILIDALVELAKYRREKQAEF